MGSDKDGGMTFMDKKVMIVTGGSAGLGLELVKAGLDAGFFVCNLGRNPEKMAGLDDLFAGKDYRGFTGDVADEEFVAGAVAEAAEWCYLLYNKNFSIISRGSILFYAYNVFSFCRYLFYRNSFLRMQYS
jgi:NAD(P)-dependent dehydrogenase (short-subunit alcohol dehydrogenase family)